MKEKQIFIPKTVYESTDGQEFDNEFDAKKHDCSVYFYKYMKDRYCVVMDSGYCVINSKEELEILQILSINYYVNKGFFSHYLDENIEFPIMVKFKYEVGINKPTKVVIENDYEWFKSMAEKFQKLCEMYELSNGEGVIKNE